MTGALLNFLLAAFGSFHDPSRGSKVSLLVIPSDGNICRKDAGLAFRALPGQLHYGRTPQARHQPQAAGSALSGSENAACSPKRVGHTGRNSAEVVAFRNVRGFR